MGRRLRRHGRNVGVTDSTIPDRDNRPGGRWSTPGLLDELLRLAACERALAHLIAGWAVKIPELDDELEVVAGLEGALVRAIALRNHALALLERDEAGLTGRTSWIAPLRELDRSPSAVGVVDAVRGDIRGFLLTRYRDLASRLDPLYDARTLVTIRAAIDALTPVSDGSTPVVDEVGPVRADLERAWVDDTAPRVPLDEILWPPLDRVPFPARPAGRPRPVTGRRSHQRTQSRLTDEDISGSLNNNVMAEMSALELLSRCSYEHPDEPWSFHLSLARHVADEERHAAIFRRLLVQRGYDESTLPQHGVNYEYAYEFPECESGGKRELTWRILIMCTVLEALAIDKLPVEIGSRDWLDQIDYARALDYIGTDELFHTENGLRLTRDLCERYGFDSMLERERAHGRFFGEQQRVRLAYLAADAERAAQEIAQGQLPDPDLMPFRSHTEVELRRRSGFTDEECRQVDRWGYNQPLDPDPDPDPDLTRSPADAAG
jgi:uncharacterized ferritin-like protein (DUF455 family)